MVGGRAPSQESVSSGARRTPLRCHRDRERGPRVHRWSRSPAYRRVTQAAAWLPPCGKRRARGDGRARFAGAVEERQLLIVGPGVGGRRATCHSGELAFEGAAADWLTRGVRDGATVAVSRIAGGERYSGKPILGNAAGRPGRRRRRPAPGSACRAAPAAKTSPASTTCRAAASATENPAPPPPVVRGPTTGRR